SHIPPPHLPPGVSLPQGIVSNCGKIPFHPYFSIKDILVFILMFLLLPTLPTY
ncbi:CYB protein, partial [Mystacornis crossleyi]|nr:CYB protein [Mystacornis crossleyi]